MRQAITKKRQRGFSLLELLVGLVIVMVMAAFAVPSVRKISQSYRISGDARELAVDLNLARMRAAAQNSHARVYFNLSANSYHVEIWNKSSACWQTDGDSNSCTQASSPTVLLGAGDTFGYGSISSGPTTATASISQPPACTTGVAGASPGSNVTSTACVEFNSRGYPVNSSNTLITSDAIYVGNTSASYYYGVTVPIAGQPTVYTYSGSAWTQY